jgi:hypothetical protein
MEFIKDASNTIFTEIIFPIGGHSHIILMGEVGMMLKKRYTNKGNGISV